MEKRDPRSAEREQKDVMLRAWFDLTTDRIMRDMPLSRQDAVKYATYVETIKQDGEFLTRREHYACRLARRIAARPSLDYLTLLLLVVSFVLGLYFGQVVGRMGRFW